MKKNNKPQIALFITALMFSLGACFLVSCEEKGPMEKAGEKIDEGVEEAADEIDDATN